MPEREKGLIIIKKSLKKALGKPFSDAFKGVLRANKFVNTKFLLLVLALRSSSCSIPKLFSQKRWVLSIVMLDFLRDTSGMKHVWSLIFFARSSIDFPLHSGPRNRPVLLETGAATARKPGCSSRTASGTSSSTGTRKICEWFLRLALHFRAILSFARLKNARYACTMILWLVLEGSSRNMASLKAASSACTAWAICQTYIHNTERYTSYWFRADFLLIPCLFTTFIINVSDWFILLQGPLAKVWLAAHWEKKLSKAQFLQTNIEKTVNAIVDQGHGPMALRLTGQLLLGIVRIYSRQARYLLDDCNEALVKIKLVCITIIKFFKFSRHCCTERLMSNA